MTITQQTFQRNQRRAARYDEVLNQTNGSALEARSHTTRPLRAGSSPAALGTCPFPTAWLGRGLPALPSASPKQQRRHQQKTLIWSTEQAPRTAAPGGQVPRPTRCHPLPAFPFPCLETEAAAQHRLTPANRSGLGGEGVSGCFPCVVGAAILDQTRFPWQQKSALKPSPPPAPQRAASLTPSSPGFAAPNPVPVGQDEARGPRA